MLRSIKKCLDEIKKEGLRCPEDVSVMGFDNFVLNNANGSMLTSIDVPRKEMGMMAVDLLFERMKYPKSLKKTVQLSVKVYERGSVKNLNK